MSNRVISLSSPFLWKKLRRVAVGSFGILPIAALALCAGCASIQKDSSAKPGLQADEASIEKDLGIKPLAVRLTAAGQMIDFRFRVIDSEKSHTAFDRKIRTYLVDQASGDRYNVPADSKLGPLRSSSRNPAEGKEYFIFFANPGKNLHPGSKVAIVIGDFKIDNLTIE